MVFTLSLSTKVSAKMNSFHTRIASMSAAEARMGRQSGR